MGRWLVLAQAVCVAVFCLMIHRALYGKEPSQGHKDEADNANDDQRIGSAAQKLLIFEFLGLWICSLALLVTLLLVLLK